ncbi:MAG TPA: polysaccharide biosynthesis/export family protein [Polyangiaceae bacterium]|nr:polysaccharide biosynthesis/export family protein [Polyangiaceae bacterium]
MRKYVRLSLRTALDRQSRLLVAGILILMQVALGCGPSIDNRHVKLEPPQESTTMSPGDVFRMEIVGEKDLPAEYQIASDGTVDLPYVHRLHVAGLEPQQAARTIRERLIQGKVLSDPTVIVSIKEFSTKRITVLGQVSKPGSFPLTPGVTLIQAISLAGGFNSIANKNSVNLTRKGKSGTRTVVLSVEAITDGRSPDVPLQGGDQIYVNERIF